MASTLVDTATQSNYLEISTEHVAFDWKVDFETKTIGGSAEHLLKVKKQGVDKVVYVLVIIFRVIQLILFVKLR